MIYNLLDYYIEFYHQIKDHNKFFSALFQCQKP